MFRVYLQCRMCTLCSAQSATCDQQCVVWLFCIVQCLLCSCIVQCIVCSVQFFFCVQCIVWSVQHAVCNVQCEVCSVKCTVCIWQCVKHWECSVPKSLLQCTAALHFIRPVFSCGFLSPALASTSLRSITSVLFFKKRTTTWQGWLENSDKVIMSVAVINRDYRQFQLRKGAGMCS